MPDAAPEPSGAPALDRGVIERILDLMAHGLRAMPAYARAMEEDQARRAQRAARDG